MVRALSRGELHRSIDRQLPTKQYEYACNFAKSEETSDITATINYQPNRGFLSTGVYHFNLVFCSCPRPKILRRIQSLFTKKIQEQETTSKELPANCRVHTNNFDVLLKSNQAICSFLSESKIN